MVFSPKVLSSSAILVSLLGTAAALVPLSIARGWGIFGSSSSSSSSSSSRSTTFLKDSSSSSEPSIRVGFLGCGTIASAIATGIATQSAVNVSSIAVSRRSESKSTALGEAFPDLVTIHDDNQEVLDRSDIIFVCLLPQYATEILKKLRFDEKRHHLVSVVSTAQIDDLIDISKLEPSRVSKMICLPSVARHQGVCLHCCPVAENALLSSLFGAMGGVTTLKDEQQLTAAMVSTCVMGPLYGVMRQGRDFLVKNGLSQKDASYLVTKQYLGMVLDADRECSDPSRLDDLVAEQTPGGINEQALTNLKKLGGLDAYEQVSEAILSRLRGETDGSIEENS